MITVTFYAMESFHWKAGNDLRKVHSSQIQWLRSREISAIRLALQDSKCRAQEGPRSRFAKCAFSPWLQRKLLLTCGIPGSAAGTPTNQGDTPSYFLFKGPAHRIRHLETRIPALFHGATSGWQAGTERTELPTSSIMGTICRTPLNWLEA